MSFHHTASKLSVMGLLSVHSSLVYEYKVPQEANMVFSPQELFLLSCSAAYPWRGSASLIFFIFSSVQFSSPFAIWASLSFSLSRRTTPLNFLYFLLSTKLTSFSSREDPKGSFGQALYLPSTRHERTHTTSISRFFLSSAGFVILDSLLSTYLDGEEVLVSGIHIIP